MLDPASAPRESKTEAEADLAPEEFVLLSGRHVVVRPIDRGDASALVDFHEHLSAASIHSRFFGAHPHLTPLEVTSLVGIDHKRRMALVALAGGEIVGVGRYEGIDQTVAEVAFTVTDRFQRQGLGTILLALLVDHARANGYAKFVAQVLAGNARMREVFEHSGLSPLFRDYKGVIDVELDLGVSERAQLHPLSDR